MREMQQLSSTVRFELVIIIIIIINRLFDGVEAEFEAVRLKSNQLRVCIVYSLHLDLGGNLLNFFGIS
jgi:hypothetical protein